MFNFAVFVNDDMGDEFCGRGNSPQTAWENLIEGNGLDEDIINFDTVQFYQEVSVTRELTWVE
jgi:hypothetical protein